MKSLVVGFRKERANFGARAAVESALREFLAVCVRKAAHLGFDCRDRRQAHAQLVHAESDQDGHGLRIAGDPAAHAGEPAMLARAFDRLCDQAEQSRIQGINLGSKLRDARDPWRACIGSDRWFRSRRNPPPQRRSRPSQPRREFPP